MNALGVAHFQSHQQRNCFQRVVASVYKITHEQVVGERDISAYGEQLDEVVELSVDVSADGDWGSDWRGVGLLHEDGSGLFCDELDLFFGDGLEAS